ncbi:hypothetical protein POTOM_000355 [Populus tomentosa]|uniref:Metal transporter Nramp1 n=1 Tax=Populus tomentosa TaxID=118781 RepID=A0A8X8AL09_POPTO|nr:hypothetical protein POTOM_000355 [Populus tomentosa]
MSHPFESTLPLDVEVQSMGPTNHNHWFRKMWDPIVKGCTVHCALCCMIKISDQKPQVRLHLVFLRRIAKSVAFLIISYHIFRFYTVQHFIKHWLKPVNSVSSSASCATEIALFLKWELAMAGSSSVQTQFIASTGNRSFSNAPLIENSDPEQVVVPDDLELPMSPKRLVVYEQHWNFYVFLKPLDYPEKGSDSSSVYWKGLFCLGLLYIAHVLKQFHDLSLWKFLAISVGICLRKSWKNLFAYMGPGFLVSIAYIDPGNFETDLQSGAQYKYELLWIILVASCAALIIQSLAANLGVVTGKHLAEHCRNEYPRIPNFILWVLAEIAIVACDIPEGEGISGLLLSIACHNEYNEVIAPSIKHVCAHALIGTAFALNMLFKIPVWIGVLLTGLSTLVLLALQQYGVRKLEFFIAFLVCTIAGCFFAELGYAKPDAKEVLKGLFVPQLKGNGAAGLAISLLGAMVMPHNLFLHSALVLSRKIPRSVHGIKEACRFYMIESGFALVLAFLINISIIAVSGAVCNSQNINAQDQENCKDLDLNKASFLLKCSLDPDIFFHDSAIVVSCLQNVLGSWSSKLFAIALLASGQSSTITGTYAGQYVMQSIRCSAIQIVSVVSFASWGCFVTLYSIHFLLQGFLDLRLTPWLRNFLTRSLAIVPSLIVAIIGGSAGAGKLIIIASMILSFELPFALVPLLKFTSSKTKMGIYANSTTISSITWVIGFLIMAINIYYLASSFIKILLHGHLKLVAAIFLGIFGFLGMTLYLAGIAYLVFRKNKKATHLVALTSENPQIANESGNAGVFSLPREDIACMQLPQRRSNANDL